MVLAFVVPRLIPQMDSPHAESMLLCRVLNGVFLRVLGFHALLRVEEPSGGRRGKLVYHLEESFFSPDRKNSRGGYGVAIAESPHLFTRVRQYLGKRRPRAALYHLSERLRSSSGDFDQR